MASVTNKEDHTPQDSISVLQQQLQRVQSLKSGYGHLHNCFLQHVSSLTHEQRLVPRQKRAMAQQAAALDISEHQDVPASTQEPADKAGPTVSPQPSTEGPSGEDTRLELLKVLKQRLDDLPSIARLEQGAASSVALDQDRLDACAVLTGRKTRYYVHQTTISVGRTSVYRGQVDIDLTLEGAGTKLSRYSCFIDLDMRYGFILHNIARQTVLVNNVPVETGKKTKLPHLSLVEICGVVLLFQVNVHALKRLCMRPPPCPA